MRALVAVSVGSLHKASESELQRDRRVRSADAYVVGQPIEDATSAITVVVQARCQLAVVTRAGASHHRGVHTEAERDQAAEHEASCDTARATLVSAIYVTVPVDAVRFVGAPLLTGLLRQCGPRQEAERLRSQHAERSP